MTTTMKRVEMTMSRSTHVRYQETGHGHPSDVYLGRRRDVTKYNNVVIVDDDPVLTVEEIEGLLDDMAEFDNYHALVGRARKLRDLIVQHGGSEEQARLVLLSVLESGGWVSF